MSDEQFTTPPIPLMSAVRARNIARGYEALAEQLEDAEMPEQAAAMGRRAQWWLTLSLSLSKTPPGAIDMGSSP